jgi:hypothetical protein
MPLTPIFHFFCAILESGGILEHLRNYVFLATTTLGPSTCPYSTASVKSCTTSWRFYLSIFYVYSVKTSNKLILIIHLFKLKKTTLKNPFKKNSGPTRDRKLFLYTSMNDENRVNAAYLIAAYMVFCIINY